MKILSKFFRRKPSPLTPAEGRAIIDEAIKRTLGSGLQGYVIAEVGNDTDGEMVLFAKGNAGEGLRKALERLLNDPETKQAAQYAIFTALRAPGKVQPLEIVSDDDCPCPTCTARRMKDGERRATTTTTH